MTIETIPGFYIHIIADNGKQLVNKTEDPEIRTNEIYVPLNGDYSMWVEENELIINNIL